MSYRRMLPFIFLNIVVSAAVVLAILWWWDGRKVDSLASAETASEILQVDDSQQESQNIESASEGLPEATNVPIPDESNESGPEMHIVAAGETLGLISGMYGVTLEEIMSANGMDNPNFLSVGQELIIPLAGAVQEAQEAVEEEPEPTESGGEDVLPTPIPTEPAGEGEAMIEIAEVIDPGQLPLEAVQIVNNGSSEAKLSEWKLADQFGNYYTFSPITLFGDGAGIIIYTTAGEDSATELYWGEEKSIWESGRMVILYDAEGAVQAEFEVP
jgi:LysM repeat protein